LLVSPALWAGTEGTSSTFYGQGAGASALSTTGDNTMVGKHAGYNTTGGVNTFLGSGAGYTTTTGNGNTFLGVDAGYSTTTAQDNAFVGYGAGYSFTTGYQNTVIGRSAGISNQTGYGNIFLGAYAGYSETGSNKLYIDNCYNSGTCISPLIYGEFDNHLLNINGVTSVAANGAPKSQMHFSLDNGDYGGFLTSVLQNNFFVSSGARYDSTAGGWIQRSADGNAMIAGSGAVGYRIFSHTGGVVGSSFTLGTPLLFIDYSGQFGINSAPVAGHQIHTSGGAYLAGGVWTDASSRAYKHDIHELPAAAAADALAALNPVMFRYNDDEQQQHVGFIAEDVPDLVAMKDRKGLAPMDIVAVLTKVVQEQKVTIEEQKTQLSSLLARMERLEQNSAHAAR
jgi:hypothetical protein